MIKRILIANRGEIACRIIDSCQRLGITSIAVYSDADREALHVQKADEAVNIGNTKATDSYLNIENIINAAKELKADAVHPGYGFLSENTEFVKKLEDSSIIFIGPSAQAISDMGEKSRSKKILEQSNIPMLVGYHGDKQDDDFLLNEAKKIGFPILIKASAGGGGKGMKIVNSKNEFIDALKSAKREAKSAFGNDHILLEKYLIAPRHVEVQVFGDKFGNYVTLGDRDCSVQRRQQKIIEEAPAPSLSEKTRSAMAKVAIEICKSINYYSAGTVEFLVDGEENFYFMEMNTRLQVEHPVTEMVTGIDLVEWQIMVADDKKLPLSQNKIKINGHAIEARLYAEDPENSFLPASGKIYMLKWPKISDKNELRIETGVKSGDEITSFYDPMIAKIVTYGNNRDIALKNMLNTLNSTYIVGVKNNINFLKTIVKNKNFVGNTPKALSTQFIDNFKDELFKPNEISTINLFLAAVGIFWKELKTHKNILTGWRLNSNSPDGSRVYIINNNKIECKVDSNNIYISSGTEGIILSYPKDICPGAFSCIINGKEFIVTSVIYRDKLYLFIKNGEHLVFDIYNPSKSTHLTKSSDGVITAPMTGKVISLNVKEGDKIQKGQIIAIMEAMKMEHNIIAPISGVVANLNVKEDIQITEGTILTKIEDKK